MLVKIVTEDHSVQEKDSRYNLDHFFDEPHSERVTVKLKPQTKKDLVDFAKSEGYTNMSVALRELISLGLEYYPVRAASSARESIERIQRMLNETQKHIDAIAERTRAPRFDE